MLADGEGSGCNWLKQKVILHFCTLFINVFVAAYAIVENTMHRSMDLNWQCVVTCRLSSLNAAFLKTLNKLKEAKEFSIAKQVLDRRDMSI